ncbi:unnamed protein product, partial [marine sediment metagenome]
RVLRQDLGLIAAAWLKKLPASRRKIKKRLKKHRATIPRHPSLSFVLNWETDTNDVDLHVYDTKRNHAYHGAMTLSSGGELYADVTTGYGPECFTIKGQTRAYPYYLYVKYYSKGPMGYGMGKVQIIQHDGKGNLKFDDRPFVVEKEMALLSLGEVKAL